MATSGTVGGPTSPAHNRRRPAIPDIVPAISGARWSPCSARSSARVRGHPGPDDGGGLRAVKRRPHQNRPGIPGDVTIQAFAVFGEVKVPSLKGCMWTCTHRHLRGLNAKAMCQTLRQPPRGCGSRACPVRRGDREDRPVEVKLLPESLVGEFLLVLSGQRGLQQRAAVGLHRHRRTCPR